MYSFLNTPQYESVYLPHPPRMRGFLFSIPLNQTVTSFIYFTVFQLTEQQQQKEKLGGGAGGGGREERKGQMGRVTRSKERCEMDSR